MPYLNDKGKTKADQFRDLIRTRILEGKLSPGAKLPTTVEYAEKHCLDKMTINRALKALAQEGLIVRRPRRGTFVAERNNAASLPDRALRFGMVTRAELTPDFLADSFLGKIAMGALSELQLLDQDPVFPLAERRATTRAHWRSPERRLTVECLGEARGSFDRRPSLKAVKEGAYDGLLSVGVIDEAWLESLLELSIPTVLVDFPNRRFSSRVDLVFVDPMSGYQDAVRHFAEQGLKRIHFVGAWRQVPAPDPQMTRSELENYRKGRHQVDPDTFIRLSAYQQAMQELGLPVREEWIHYAFSDPRKLGTVLDRMIGRSARDRAEAVICHGLDHAEALVAMFEERGARLEAAGAASELAVGRAHPIIADLEELGATAMELLLSRLERPGRRALDVGLQMQFVPRAFKGAKKRRARKRDGRVPRGSNK